MSDAGTPSTRSVVVGAAGLGLFGLLAGLVVATLLLVTVEGLAPQVRGSLPARNAILTIGQGIGLAAVALFYLRVNDLPWAYLRVSWPTVRQLLVAVGTVVVLFALLVGALELLERLGVTAAEHSVAETAEENPRVLLPLIPISILVTGPAEELLYRGVIQTRLTEVFDAATAVLAASVIFALVHVPAYAVGAGLGAELAATLAILLVLGACLGAAYEYTGNLLVPAIAHGAYNAITYGSSYLTMV